MMNLKNKLAVEPTLSQHYMLYSLYEVTHVIGVLFGPLLYAAVKGNIAQWQNHRIYD
jgi:hypothetical protein